MECENCCALKSGCEHAYKYFNDEEKFVQVYDVKAKESYHFAHEHAFKCLKCGRVIFATYNSHHDTYNMWFIHD